jgi:hypothetical protein
MNIFQLPNHETKMLALENLNLDASSWFVQLKGKTLINDHEATIFK